MTVNVTETDLIICSIAERAMALYRYSFNVNIKELGNQESVFSQILKNISYALLEISIL